MVFGSCVDLISPVDLLQQHDPGQMMGKCHGGHGKAQVRLGLNGFVQAHAAADEKHQAGVPAHGEAGHAVGQLGRGEGLSLDAHGDDGGTLGELGADERGLRLQSLTDLGGGGIVGQTALRQLDDVQTAKTAEALGVFGHSLCIEPLFQLAHAYKRYFLHAALPLGT